MRYVCAFVILLVSADCFAGINVSGLTVPIDITDIANQDAASQKEAEYWAIVLTNRLHSNGYTTSYVSRFELSGGICTLYVVESRIMEITVAGNDRVQMAMLQDLLSLHGQVYNKNAVYKELSQLKQKYFLRSIDADVVNYNDTGDVHLIVSYKEKQLHYSIEISTIPVYGVSPAAVVSKPMHNALFSVKAQTAFDDKRVTLQQGAFDYTNYRTAVWRTGFAARREYGVWERHALSYNLTTIRPFIGIGSILDARRYDVHAFIYGVAGYYRAAEIEHPSHDMGLELNIKATNERHTVARKKTVLDISLTGAVAQKYFVTFRAEGSFPVQVAGRFFCIPNIYSFHTTNDNRIYAEYVFDRQAGYSKRYTSSHSRHIAGMRLVYELSYELVYVEIFGSAGVYENEYAVWKHTGNYGAAIEAAYGSVLARAGCAWNVEETFDAYQLFTSIQAQW